MPSFIRSYQVTHLNPDSEEGIIWGVTVEYRGPDQWAVCSHRRCLNSNGEMEHESLPSSRTDEFKASTRFDLHTALAMAEDYADRLVMNGMTWRDVADHEGVSGG